MQTTRAINADHKSNKIVFNQANYLRMSEWATGHKSNTYNHSPLLFLANVLYPGVEFNIFVNNVAKVFSVC